MHEPTLLAKHLTQLKRKLSPVKAEYAIEGTQLMTQEHGNYLPELELEIVSGHGRGQRFPIETGRHTLGRAAGHPIRLADASISALHATLEYKQAGKVVVYDAASTNGISLRGVRKPTIEVRVGEVMQVGRLFLRLRDPQKKTAQPFWMHLKAKGVSVSSSLHQLLALRWKEASACLVGGMVILALVIGLDGKPSPAKAVETPTQVNPAQSSVANLSPPLLEASPVSSPAQKTAVRSVKKRAITPKRQAPQETSRRPNLDEVMGRAEKAMQQGNYALAYSLWRNLSQLPNALPQASENLRELDLLASKLYEEALMVSGTSMEQAGELLQKVMNMTDPQSLIHQKARNTWAQWRAS